MTVKRFILNIDGETINDGDNRYCGEGVVEFLNELHEKNILLLQNNGKMEEEIECLSDENEQLKQYKQAVNDVLDSYYQRDLTPIEELLLGGIARELNIDLHYKKR